MWEANVYSGSLINCHVDNCLAAVIELLLSVGLIPIMLVPLNHCDHNKGTSGGKVEKLRNNPLRKITAQVIVKVNWNAA